MDPAGQCGAASWRVARQSCALNALNLVGKIGPSSSFGENSLDRRKNAETFRLSTLKVARKSFVSKGV